MQFSSLLQNLSPSATVRMNSLALQKKSAGQRVYNLSAGEPMVAVHPLIAQAIKQALAQGKTHYAPVEGIPELRQAAVNWLAQTYEARYEAEECLVTCGGKFGIYATCQALLNPGDEVVILAPYWVSYPTMARIFGGLPKIVKTQESNGWKASAPDIAAAFSSRTKLLILNNAANPTGALYNKEELRAILTLCAEQNVMVLSDEVYSGLVYDQNQFISCGSFPKFKNNLIIIQSCSKHFAMTGLRVGFVLAPEPLIKTLTSLQSQSTTGTSSLSQYAALAALQNASVIIPEVRGAMQKRRDVLVNSFQELFGAKTSPLPSTFPIVLGPLSGLYAFVSMKSLGIKSSDSIKWCEELLEGGNIATVPGASFGQEGYVRFSFGAEEKELEEALRVLRKFV